jgi:xanthine dehydrogenase accessory factor
LNSSIVLIRGGGDLGSGVALRLYHAGLRVVITEQPQPLVVRRSVSFAEAVYQGEFDVEGISARRASSVQDSMEILRQGAIPIVVDPQVEIRKEFQPLVLVDARMMKKAPGLGKESARLVVGLGPGFVAGENCHAVVETHRGHTLGRVIWEGSAKKDTGIPDGVLNRRAERVLRAPAEGVLKVFAEIGDILEAGQMIAEVAGVPVEAPFHGVLRGLLHPDLYVKPGQKIGDVDPRADPLYCTLVSDKSLAIGGGVLEAILSIPEIRVDLWA